MAERPEPILCLRRYKMPGMIRPHGRAKKIAYSILGEPANMKKRSPAEKEIDRKLIFQETARVR
jgi:hypothetical protein